MYPDADSRRQRLHRGHEESRARVTGSARPAKATANAVLGATFSSVKAVIQRVARASVVVHGETVGRIGGGLLVLLGVGHDDTPADATVLVDKLLGLRIFPDHEEKMNRSVVDAEGSVLVVSQFTLLADIRKGRRPSFTGAAAPAAAAAMVDRVVELIESRGINVATGEFGAMMEVELLNSGPVTIVIDVEDGRVQ